MSETRRGNAQDGQRKLAQFRAAENDDRVFRYPTCHPSQPTGFCPCDGPAAKAMWFYLKTAFMNIVLQLPFNRLSIWLLRRMGAQIGNNVYISAGVWIDSMFPDLLTIEDNVLIGVGVKMAMHEFRLDEFIAGRITIRRGAIIGGFSLIGPGVEVGEYATVAGGAAIARDVPAHAVAGGNPARVVSR
ncbi:MAG: hypothetical protein JSU72_16450 [Deltaproteobacteria bacterium]|nr:MAG: hypothetical protein JSU72_16450 [Deltaproteobacteria bacterium]